MLNYCKRKEEMILQTEQSWGEKKEKEAGGEYLKLTINFLVVFFKIALDIIKTKFSVENIA